MKRANLYLILGVTPTASDLRIRRSYQRLARRYHPAVQADERAGMRRYRQVVRAFQVLSDPVLRRQYDADRRHLVEEAEPAGTADSLELGGGVHATGGESHAGSGFPETPSRSGSGKNLTVELELDFSEAIRGATASFSVQRESECGVCAGEGSEDTRRCSACGGRGAVVNLERLRVRLPPGVDDGSRLRLPGRGNRGGPHGSPGALDLVTRVRPHPYFERRGGEIHADLPITLVEAVGGGEVEVPTVDGPVRARIPAGTSGGRRFRLRGRGVPGPDGRVGDHIYTVRVVVPRQITPDLKKALGEIEQEDPRRDLPKTAI